MEPISRTPLTSSSWTSSHVQHSLGLSLQYVLHLHGGHHSQHGHGSTHPCGLPLHTPMYFLLNHFCNMYTVSICHCSQDARRPAVQGKTIYFLGCALQIFLYLTLIGEEFFRLGLMAYDWYVAEHSPLWYHLLKNCRICLIMILGSWVGGSLNGFILIPVTMSFPYCRSQEIDQFFYEISAVLKLSCINISLYENLMYACCMLMLLIPISFTSVSYMHILITIYHMNSVEGKVFTTCPSHIMLVSMFFGAAFYTNILPCMPEKNKVVSAFYTILNPMLNPLIYSLRNKEVASALRKVLGRYASSQRIREGMCLGNTRGPRASLLVWPVTQCVSRRYDLGSEICLVSFW